MNRKNIAGRRQPAKRPAQRNFWDSWETFFGWGA